MIRKLKSVTSDNRSVDIADDYSVEYWARQFNVNHDKLKKAVRNVGTAVEDVIRELKK